MSLPLANPIRTISLRRGPEKPALAMRGAGLTAAALCVASVLAVLFALGRFFEAPRTTASALLPILVWELGRWYIWVLLVPLLQRALDRRLPAQVAAVIATSALHTLIMAALEQVMPVFLAGPRRARRPRTSDTPESWPRPTCWRALHSLPRYTRYGTAIDTASVTSGPPRCSSSSTVRSWSSSVSRSGRTSCSTRSMPCPA